MKFLGYYVDDNLSITLTEYLPGGELFRYISSTKYKLTEAKCQIFAKQILLAIEFMHSKRIIHLDLKPENILLVNDLMDSSKNNQSSEALKLIDFGLAKNLGIRKKIPMNMCGTLEFISPEVLRCSHASFASDMWSAGVIMYMMISGGISPFWSGTEYGTQYHIHRAQLARGGFNHRNFKNVSKESIECVAKLLTLEPKSRLTASECLQHTWLSSLSHRKLSAPSQSKQLETAWLRKYLARRRWKRWIITIKALNRMIKLGESVSSNRKENPKKLQENQKVNDQDLPTELHSNPIINANGLSDRLKQLMVQNYGDLGMR